MNDLTFVPHYDPRSDFLVTTADSPDLRAIMLGIGANAVERKGYTAYVWNTRLGDRFLLGLGVLDGKFWMGPRKLRHIPNRLGAGNYTIVDMMHDTAAIYPDPFGMEALYSSTTLVTNRLHLAGIATRQIDVNNALSVMYNDGGFSFSFNTFATPVRDVSVIPAGAHVELFGGALHVIRRDERSEFATRDPQAYWELIKRGTDEVVENVVAVVESGLPIFADITGGRDSRVVFGALLAAGKQRDVIFNTISNPTSPGLQKDLEIGTGLVALYGGRYSGRPTAVGYAEHSIEQNLLRRRSHMFGAYHWIVPTDVRPVITLTKTQSVRMLGGGGELYRDYWRPMLFTSIVPDELATDEVVQSMLLRHRGSRFGARYFDSYINDLLATFRCLPGESLGHKLDAHYLNFRNRFHFGPRQSTPESMSTVNVATAPSLLAASRALPSSERAAGRVLFDVIRTLDEKLAYLPFDTDGDPRIFNSPYHRSSRYDAAELSLEPAVHLAKEATTGTSALRPKMPQVSPWKFEDVLDREIASALEILSDPASPFGFLVDDELHAYIEWAQAHSPRNRSSLASKLRAFADYSQL